MNVVIPHALIDRLCRKGSQSPHSGLTDWCPESRRSEKQAVRIVAPSQVAAAGHKIVVKERELRPGVTIGIVADPDGNWVEFLSVA